MAMLRYCTHCQTYTLDSVCAHCNKQTIEKYPPRFSPQDRYGAYRRKLKKLEKGE